MKRKDLLGLDGVSREEITSILDTALMMRQVVRSNNKKTPHLQGKSIVTLFYENSTRTRMSFELASKYMSAAAANISASASSVAKGETLIDTGVTLDQMGTDVIIIRHPMSGAPTLLAKYVKASVINAGDGMNEHPTQALLDMLTMREHLGGLEGAKVAICGDVMHSRVARSNIYGLTTMGAKVVLCAPPTLIPPRMDEMGCTIAPTIEDAKYENVVRRLIETIRRISPTRTIIVDGLDVGNRPLMEIADLRNIIQSGRGYQPMLISHYGANWVYGDGPMYYPR